MKLCGIDGCCDHLENRLVDGGKGFKALHTLEMGDPSPLTRFLGVVYKTGAKDRGLLLNVCPWCGGKPGYYERDETANALAQGRAACGESLGAGGSAANDKEKANA